MQGPMSSELEAIMRVRFAKAAQGGDDDDDDSNNNGDNDDPSSYPKRKKGERDVGGLLKLSDFCTIGTQGKSSRHRRRGGRRMDGGFSHERQIGPDSTADEGKEDVVPAPVSISILHEVPNYERRRTAMKYKRTSTSSSKDGIVDVDDEYATVYTDEVELLHRLRIFDGHICKLYRSCRTAAGDNDNCGDGVDFVPVIVRVVPSSSLLAIADADPTNTNTNTNTNINPHDDDNYYHLYVPPILAASIGIHTCLPTTLRRHNYLAPLVNVPTTKGADMEARADVTFRRNGMAVRRSRTVRLATRASLAEVSVPPADYLPSFARLMDRMDVDVIVIGKTEGNSNTVDGNGDASRERLVEERDMRRERQIRSLKDYFYADVLSNYRGHDDDDGATTKRRRRRRMERKRLVTNGSLLAVANYDGDYDGGDCPRGTMTEGGDGGDGGDDSLRQVPTFRFYKIVRIHGNDMNDDDDDDDDMNRNVDLTEGGRCFWISPKTELTMLPRLDDTSRHDDRIHRLPRRSMLHSFHSSIAFERESYEGECTGSSRSHGSSSSSGGCCHPSVENMTNAILLLGHTANNSFFEGGSGTVKGSGTVYSSSTLHIVGHEDNHVQVCLDAVADIVGMNIIHVRGLAAFSYHYGILSPEEQDGTRNSISGSLVDKLKGVRAAFRIARRSMPCMIHICMDDELGSYDDVEACRDEENRFLACFRKEFVSSSSSSSFLREKGAMVGEVIVPPNILILSTSKPFPKGPISSSLTYKSVNVSEPDEAYAQSLWCGDDSFHRNKVHFMGRTANEIVMLSREFHRIKEHQKSTMTELSNESTIIKSILEDMSKGPVVFSENDALSLSSSLIPNVKWEDVGGLAHVREEIMDAIELPLQYPQLFQGICRSGILLFGPPGSGKTLVAKAVATECGIPFMSVKGPELLGSYVGESEANIRAAFDAARKAAIATSKRERGGGAVLFFDEIDSLAPRRGELGDGGGVMERVVATILSELDIQNQGDQGIKATIFLIGATNRPDLLDPSLLRPGRFDRLVYLGLAKKRQDRLSILASQTRTFKFENGMDANTMADRVIDSIPEGLSGADFSSIGSGALKKALQRRCDEVDEKVFQIQSEGHHSLDTIENITENILNDWPKEDLTPVVTIEDFISAANQVVPSVDEKEIQRYEALRDQFCSQI